MSKEGAPVIRASTILIEIPPPLLILKEKLLYTVSRDVVRKSIQLVLFLTKIPLS